MDKTEWRGSKVPKSDLSAVAAQSSPESFRGSQFGAKVETNSNRELEMDKADRLKLVDEGAYSVNLIVRADGFQEQGFSALVLNELEDYPQVIPGATSPRASQIALQFVGLEPRIKGIFRQQLQSDLNVCRRIGVLSRQPPGRTDEGVGGQEQPFQARIFFMI